MTPTTIFFLALTLGYGLVFWALAEGDRLHPWRRWTATADHSRRRRWYAKHLGAARRRHRAHLG